jgi:hypothetical protein
VRQSVKIPLEREEWFRVIDAIRDYQDLGDAMRAVLGMMAMRGFRCGDVMRMKRAEISAALETGTLSFEAKGSKRLEFAVIDTFRPHLEALAAIDTRWIPWSQSARSPRGATVLRFVRFSEPWQLWQPPLRSTASIPIDFGAPMPPSTCAR